MNPGIIKKDRVLLPGAEAPGTPTPNAALPSANTRACRKSVRTIAHEGRVRAIEVTCSCGEKTLVELDIEEKNAS